MYPFILRLEYWDDFETPWKRTIINVLIYAESMAAAVAQVESANLVPNLENIGVLSVADKGTLFSVPDDVAQIFIAGGGDYEEGTKIKED